jgi:hypothetical protein
MQKLKSRILYEEIKDGNNGGGGLSVPPPIKEPTITPNSTEIKPQGGVEYDKFGYEIKQAKQEVPIKEDPPIVPPKEDEIKLGYETAPVEPVKEDPPIIPPKENEVDFGKLGDSDKKIMSEYFNKFELSKEAREALIKIKQEESINNEALKVEHQKKVDAEVVRLKSQWYNELKSDKTFGGDKFDSNIKTVNKFIADFMPNVKNMLTDKGTMLPPNIMKDYLSVAEKLYTTEKLVQGDPLTNETKSKGKYDFLNDLYQ